MKTILIVAGGVALTAGALYAAYKLFRKWRIDNGFAVDYDIEDEHAFMEN